MVVYAVVFGTYACGYTQTIPKTLVILEEEGCIITFVHFIHYSRVITDVFESHSRSDLCATVPFLVELIVEIIVKVLVCLSFRVESRRIDNIRQPRYEIAWQLSVLYSAKIRQPVIHNP